LTGTATPQQKPAAADPGGRRETAIDFALIDYISR
jgi:hypothetical protein